MFCLGFIIGNSKSCVVRFLNFLFLPLIIRPNVDSYLIILTYISNNANAFPYGLRLNPSHPAISQNIIRSSKNGVRADKQNLDLGKAFVFM